MVMKRRWSDLSEGQRRGLMVMSAVEGLLKIAALIDLKRRPASQVRGPKWAWATAISVVSSAGVLPISYFLFGRRRESRPRDERTAALPEA
jgi:hypothetical protein